MAVPNSADTSTDIVLQVAARLGEVLASSASPQAYLSAAVDILSTHFAAHAYGFAGPDSTHPCITASTGLKTSQIEPPSGTLSAAVIAAWVSTLPTEPRPATISLEWQQTQQGVIVLWPEHDSTLPETISTLGPHIAAGLRALGLAQAAESRLAETITLQHITQAISASLDFDHVCTTLLKNAQKFFSVDAVALALESDDGKEFYARHSIGLSQDYASKLRLPASSPFIAELVKQAGPMQFDVSAGEAPITGNPELSRKEGIKSLVLIPILSGKKPLGALGLVSKVPRTFTAEELRFGQSLAEHAGIAFSNARLHANLRRASTEVEQTRSLMRDGLIVLDRDRTIQYVNPAADEILGLSSEHVLSKFTSKQLEALPHLAINTSEMLEAITSALSGDIGRTQFSVEGQSAQHFEAICSPYRDTSGKSLGALISIRDITPLFLEKEKLQAIQNGISEGLILVDNQALTLECNEEWRRLFGVTDNLIGQPFFSLLTSRPDFNSDHNPTERIQEALRGKRLMWYAHDLEHGRHIQISVNPVTMGGHVSGAVATARDITSLIEKTVEANEMAAKAHRHLRELSQLAELSGIVGFNVANIYQKYLSKTASLLESGSVSLYLYRATGQQLIRDQATNPDASDPAIVELSSKHLVATAFSARQPMMGEGKGAGKYRIALPIAHHSKTLGVLLVGRDSGSYGEHEAKLLRMVATRLAVLVENANLYHDVNARRERWEAVFRFTEEGIVIFDRGGVIVGFNPASTQITGFNPADAIGKPFAKIIRSVGPDAIAAAGVSPLERVLGEGVTITKSEQLLENRSGNRVWTEISFSPIFDDAGRVTSGIAIIRNTSKDREVEEIKSDFISIVSHELRTPLTAIKGFLSMTLRHDFGPLSEKQYHYLSRVYQSNQRMIDLVEDLMDATYIESGKITLNINPVALDAVVSTVVSELAAKGAASGIMINVRRRQRLPLVLADETRLHQVVLNLVDNAIKYSMPSTEVQVSFRVHGDELITTVTDHGVGIGKGQIDRLFTKFGRIFNPLSVQAGGTGLGLYIVKNLIESHDGRIWVTSQEGKGSKFNFSLPIAKQLPLIE